MHGELGELMDRLREDAGRLSNELRALERDVVEIGPATDDMAEDEDPLDEPLQAAEPEEQPTAEEPPDEPAVEAPPDEPTVEAPPDEPVSEGIPETAAGKARAKRGRKTPAKPKAPAKRKAEAADRSGDEEAARLVALDMALGGTPREETEKYLAEHYALDDPGRVLDDVYELAGS
jgi:outer membrane biosynthesis protein TonB